MGFTTIYVLTQPVCVLKKRVTEENGGNPDFWRYIAQEYAKKAKDITLLLYSIKAPENAWLSTVLLYAKKAAINFERKLNILSQEVNNAYEFENCAKELYLNEFYIINLSFEIFRTNKALDEELGTKLNDALYAFDEIFDFVCE